MRLCVLGASSVASIQLATVLAENFDNADLEVTLYGRQEHRLRQVEEQWRTKIRGNIRVRATTNLKEALKDVDVVLLQVRIGGLEARHFDESFPHEAHLPGEETLGPGGLANALRTVAGVAPLFEAIAEVARGAQVIVLTNPAGVVRALGARYGLTILEACEAPHNLLSKVASALGGSMHDYFDRYIGCNHAGFYIPDTVEELSELAPLVEVPLEIVMEWGALPQNYLKYYANPTMMYEAQRNAPTRAQQLMKLEAGARDRLEGGEEPDPSARPVPWYELAVLPVLRMLNQQTSDKLIVGTANQGRLPTLPKEVTLEGPTLYRDDAWLVSAVRSIPEGALGLLRNHAHYEECALEAALAPTRETIGTALAANPMVHAGVSISLLTNHLLEMIET